jgi:hypothetical protein
LFFYRCGIQGHGMTYAPPLDQRIVDEYFYLSSNKKTKNIAWLYGMVATYGVKPEDLIDFDWGPDCSITVPGRKRLIRPLHPQWVFLFSLKEKQPCISQSCLPFLASSLFEAMATVKIGINLTDLMLAYKDRKNYYRQLKRRTTSRLVFAGVS